MSEELTRDPNFRSQYESGITPDDEFEAALAGQAAPVTYMRPATRPLSGMEQFAPFVKLK